MIDPIINGTILIVFGLAMGAILQLYGLLARGFTSQTLRRKVSSEEGKGNITLRRLLRESKKKAEEGRTSVQTMPKSGVISMIAAYGLIIVIILIVKFSPVEMQWFIFIGAILVGFMAMDRIFTLARKGKIRVEGQSFLDILPKSKSAKD